MHIVSKFWTFFPKSDLYKTASKPSKYTFKKSFNQDGAKSNKDTAVKSQSAQFSSDWEPEDVEKVITEELREIQETLMVSMREIHIAVKKTNILKIMILDIFAWSFPQMSELWLAL